MHATRLGSWMALVSAGAALGAAEHCGEGTGLSTRDASTDAPWATVADTAPDQTMDCDVVVCPVEAGPSLPPVPCPGSPPAEGSPCPVPGEWCEYGPSWWSSCNLLVSCTTAGWHTQQQPQEPCLADAASTCPPSWAAATAPDAGLLFNCPAAACQYPEGWCACVACSAGQSHPLLSGEWSCMPATPECPSPRPLIGQPCTLDAGARCNYDGDCCNGMVLWCGDGVWVGAQGTACP